MNRLEPWQDLILEDISGEEWRDIPGYDGYYQISNFGRIKSLQRYNRRGYLVKEKIRKQNLQGTNRDDPGIGLSLDGVNTGFRVNLLVAKAFLREKQEGECCYHKNKVKTDNRVSNLVIGSFSESGELDYKLGLKVDSGIRNESLKTRSDYENEFCIYDKGKVIAKICTACMIERPISEYYIKRGLHVRQCKSCFLKRNGIIEPGKLLYHKDLSKAGLKSCSSCGQIKKLEEDFNKNKHGTLGRSSICKECNRIASTKYREARKT